MINLSLIYVFFSSYTFEFNDYRCLFRFIQKIKLHYNLNKLVHNLSLDEFIGKNCLYKRLLYKLKIMFEQLFIKTQKVYQNIITFYLNVIWLHIR